jgi:hypothetical protein
MDGFNTYESLNVMTYCFKNNIILCCQPLHTTYKTQPCDVRVFSLLKTAYRKQVDLLYRGRAETANKAHFTKLYSQARSLAITSRNIRSGWSKTGLYPFNPAKVLDDMQEVPASPTSAPVMRGVPLQPLLSLTLVKTPTNTVSLAALQHKLEERPERVTSTDLYVEKVLYTAQQAFAERELLREENKTLF